MRDLKKKKFFSHRSGGQKSKLRDAREVSFLPNLSLVCRWQPSTCIFSHGLPSTHVCVLISCSYKDTSHTELGLTTTTSFNLNYHSKSPISKYSHIPRYWELGFQHMNLGAEGGCDSAHYSRLLSWRGWRACSYSL